MSPDSESCLGSTYTTIFLRLYVLLCGARRSPTHGTKHRERALRQLLRLRRCPNAKPNTGSRIPRGDRSTKVDHRQSATLIRGPGSGRLRPAPVLIMSCRVQSAVSRSLATPPTASVSSINYINRPALIRLRRKHGPRLPVTSVECWTPPCSGLLGPARRARARATARGR